MTGEPLRIVPVQVQPGDILVIDGTTDVSKLIEVGAVLAGEPAASHVAVFHHPGWCIEGRPGGVGWADANAYLKDPRTLTNAVQPKNAKQRQAVCDLAVKMLQTPYDWVGGIAEDAMRALRLPQLWEEKDAATGLVPGHVVCSSLAAWVYDKVGLAAPHPKDWQHVTPGDWSLFIAKAAW